MPSLSEISSALERTAVVGVDVETTGLSPQRDRVRLLSLATPERVWLVDCFEVDPRPLWPVLQSRTLVGHNFDFDLRHLWQLGFRPGKVECTMHYARLLSAAEQHTPKGYHGLAAVAQRTVGVSLSKELQRSNWGGRLSQEQLAYAMQDAAVLLPIRETLLAQLHAAGLDQVAGIERRSLPAVVWMGAMGVPFDGTTWESLAHEAEQEALRIQVALDAAAPATPNAQLGLEGMEQVRCGWEWEKPEMVKRAFRELGFDLTRTGDAELAAIEHPAADLLRRYRAQLTLTQRYGRAWLERVLHYRIFPEWLQLGSRAGRMSCENPTFQNLPRDKRYRACIAAPPGRRLVKADYSQIELRIAAKISQDRRMLDAYRDGQDLHTLTAQAILGKDEVTKADRQVAKSANFGLLYGMGAAGFRAYAAGSYGVEISLQEAEKIRRAFFQTYRGLAQWHRAQTREPEDMRTLCGRRRSSVSFFTLKLNSPVQGTGADGLKRALALLWERRSEHPNAWPVIACHDEIVMECDADDAPAVEGWLRKAMIDGMEPLTHPVPCEVETQIGPTWAG